MKWSRSRMKWNIWICMKCSTHPYNIISLSHLKKNRMRALSHSLVVNIKLLLSRAKLLHIFLLLILVFAASPLERLLGNGSLHSVTCVSWRESSRRKKSLNKIYYIIWCEFFNTPIECRDGLGRHGVNAERLGCIYRGRLFVVHSKTWKVHLRCMAWGFVMRDRSNGDACERLRLPSMRVSERMCEHDIKCDY